MQRSCKPAQRRHTTSSREGTRGAAVNALELVLLLLGASAGLAVVAERLRVSYPILLVLGGLALALVPGLPQVTLDPEFALLVFLPPILFSAAWFTSWRDFAANRRSIGLLAVGLVLATTTAVAWVAHAVVPGLSWPVAFVLGAIVSPPDAVAATAVLQRLQVPRRIVTVLEGESLVNDATGFVAYTFAVAAVSTGTFSAAGAGARFVLVAVGGLAVGLAVGWLVAQVHRRMEDFVLETVLTLLTPYVAYIAAEHLGVSGVLATVAAGGYLGWRNPELLSALTRFRSKGVWSVLLLLFNGLVFTLIGLQLASWRHLTSTVPPGSLLGWIAAVAGAAVLVRLIYVPLMAWVPRLIPRVRAVDPFPAWQHVAVVAFTGMRGIVSLALALGLPLTLSDGAPFPERDLVIVLSFGVILLTLVVQGLTLPWFVRVLGVSAGNVDLQEEREGLVRGAERALARLDEIDRATVLNPAMIERLRAPYAERYERLTTEQRDDPECLLTEGEAAAFHRLRDQLLAAERRAVVELRDEGRISAGVLERLQEGIDLEALQPDR